MLEGSIVAIITPWKNGQLDRDALAKLIDFQIENGTSAILPCGTTGESATMSHAEHREVVKFTIERVAGRVPVVAGAGSNATSEAVELTADAKKMGADATLQVAPYYNKPTQEGLYLHYKAINDAVDLPMVVYNVPGRTGVNIEPDTVARLSELPNVAALKDASGSIDYTSAVVAKCDLDVFSGNDSMNLPIMALGGKGAISVLANIAPRAVADLCDAAQKRDWDSAMALHKNWFPLCQTLFVESNPIPVKAAAEMMGLCGGELRLPMCPITEANRAVLRTALETAGLL